MPKPASRPGFTEARLQLIEAATVDARLSDCHCRLLACLALRYANRDRFEAAHVLECWPSQSRLADELGITAETVRKGTLALQQHGYLTFTPARGRGQASLYRLSTFGVDPPTEVGPSARKAPTAVGPSERQPPTQVGVQPPTGKATNHDEVEPFELDSSPSDSSPAHKALAAWNETAASCGLPRMRDATPGRLKAAGARLREIGPTGWANALEAVASSPFLCGHSARGWKCDIDWLLKPSNLAKVLEGRYAPRAGDQASTAGRFSATAQQIELLQAWETE